MRTSHRRLRVPRRLAPRLRRAASALGMTLERWLAQVIQAGRLINETEHGHGR